MTDEQETTETTTETTGPCMTHEELGARLKEARVNAGLSQAQVGRLLGWHQSAVACCEAGTRVVKATELIAFAELYEVGYDWLLGQFSESDLPDELVAMAEKLPPIDRRKLLRTLASFGQMY